MRSTISWLVAGVGIGLGIFVASASAKEEKLPLDQVPKAVMDTVKERFKGAEITEAARETEDEKTFYEVTIKDKGQKIDVTVTPDGELTMIERTIEQKGLPKPVTKSLETKYPKAIYNIVEEIIKVEKKQEKLDLYEVLLTSANKKKVEVKLAPDGKIVAEENKDAGDDD